MYKHNQSEHENEEMQFSMQITNKFRDPLSRQANEAVRISNRGRNEILNSKNEFNHPPITRISVERRKNNFSNKNAQAQPSLLIKENVIVRIGSFLVQKNIFTQLFK